MEGVGRVEEGAEFETGGVGLGAAFRGEFDAVVRGVLVDGAVFVAFGLGVADEDDEARFSHDLVRRGGQVVIEVAIGQMTSFEKINVCIKVSGSLWYGVVAQSKVSPTNKIKYFRLWRELPNR